MKKLLFFASMLASVAAIAGNNRVNSSEVVNEAMAVSSPAQDSKAAEKKAKAIEKKAQKLAKQRAKELAKEGWKPGPGTMPIERQLLDLYRKQLQDEELRPDNKMYFFASYTNTGQTYTAAKLSATEFAHLALAGQMESNVAAITDIKVANGEISPSQAKSLTQVISEGKTMINQKLGNTPIAAEFYKEEEGIVKIQLTMYSSATLAKSALIKALEEASEENRQLLNEVIKNWGKGEDYLK